MEFRTRRGTLTAVDDVSFDLAPERCSASWARAALASRSRLGAHRPPDAAGPHRRRRGAPQGRAHRQPAAGGPASHPRAPHRHDLPGPPHLAEPAAADRRPAHRDHPHPPAPRCQRGAGTGHRPSRRGGHSRGAPAHRPLPAPVLRRHAPARGDRPRAGLRSGDRHRRRADDRPRCLRAGPDHRRHQAAVPREGHGGDPHHPRHGRHRRDRRPCGGDVCRAARRDRPGAGCHRSAPPSLYARPHGRHSPARRGGGAPRADPRLHAAAFCHSRRLRLPSALRARLRPLRGGTTASLCRRRNLRCLLPARPAHRPEALEAAR